MRRNPQILFGLCILAAPLHSVEWEVEADSDEAKNWIDATLKRISLSVAGRGAGGATIRIRFVLRNYNCQRRLGRESRSLQNRWRV